VTEETGALMIAVRWWGSFGGDIIEKVIETPRYHACELETSMMLALGQRVQMDKAKKWIPKSPSKYMKFYFPARLPYVEPALGSICSWDKVAKLGLVGDPTRASKEKGERIIQEVVDRLADFLRELKSLKV
jgi:creatinine amidohydrolase